MKTPKEAGISESWLQVFVDQTMLWNDDRELRKYVQYLIDNNLAPKPSGKTPNATWEDALKRAEDNFPIDVLDYLQLMPVCIGGSPELIERDDIPEEHWKDLYIGLRGTYRSYIGEEPYGIRKLPITVALGLFEQALRANQPIAIPHRYKNVAEPKRPMSRKELLAKGLITPEDKKPEWLRNLNGSHAPVAHWFPADRDGNPVE
jgi:hypothetical protein